jgi:hypothetical protein
MGNMERKNSKKYPRQHCCVEEHEDWKILELHIQSWKKRIGNFVFLGMIYSLHHGGK